MKKYEAGSTLIVVMALLVIITIIGTLAVKNSLVSLNIATNSQAQQIMMQNSDAVTFMLEDKNKRDQYFAGNGVIGIGRGKAEYKEKELVFCMTNTADKFFELDKASIISWEDAKPGPTNNSLGTEGYCNIENAEHYTSGRKAVLTQVALRYTSTPTNPFQMSDRGTDNDSSKSKEGERLMVFSLSLMPALAAEADPKDVNDCLSKHLSLAVEPIEAKYDPNNSSEASANAKGKISVSQCLSALNVPHTTHIIEYKASVGPG